ncbi:lipopolysaccharide 1,2-N-acetylglucosaminetransferase [Luteitalea pratensis]|uniref:Lipopolysaccharide 1,2-N-acetylglucosaminetransferase n=1 Tax=Luteitalea pratensis TaxID=1855912 RepID=A0A143PGI4_LUTPR|nr:lipopolysaccharide 1,2-N-acetylglucosaminetransferase [Luteitalea pratensis]
MVQRYGADINGGAELHARYIAERLARKHEVEVLTTCAHDYVTWRNEYPAGEERLGPLLVRRFEVSRERDPDEFGRKSFAVFETPHSITDELAWLDAEGPTSPALVAHIKRHASSYDYLYFFSYRYHHAYHGVRAAADRAILVPTAERDPAIGLGIFPPIFRGVRAVMYNSHEERAMIHAVAGNEAVPGVVVGVGSEIPQNAVAERFRRTYDIRGPFVLYVGRIDENKGCRELFQFFQQYLFNQRRPLHLVLAGKALLPIPDHPLVRHVGFISDQDKYDALAGCEALIMPSFFESLSMVAIEAWALGKPVLANARCDVLQGQCLRSNAGLFYADYPEFAETLHILTSNRSLSQALGENGRTYFRDNYAWPVIDAKYDATLQQLRNAAPTPGAIEALPGWIARHRGTVPPGREILDALPAGPAPRPAATGPRTRPEGPPRGARRGMRQRRSGRPVATRQGR